MCAALFDLSDHGRVAKPVAHKHSRAAAATWKMSVVFRVRIRDVRHTRKKPTSVTIGASGMRLKDDGSGRE
jgi:hypothetical protein